MRELLSKYKISAHTFSGAVVSAVGVYLSVPEVKGMVDAFLSNHKSLSAIVAAVVAIVVRYWSATKPPSGDAEALKKAAAGS